MLTCSFLSYLSPVQLTKLLTHWANSNAPYLNPIWLNNDGQNVLGFLPKKAFYLQVPATKSISNQSYSYSYQSNLQLMTVTQETVPDFIKMKTLDSTNPFNGSSENLKIQLSNHQTLDSFSKTLIAYSNEYVADNKDTVYANASDISNNNSNRLDSGYKNGFMGYIGYDVTARELAYNDKGNNGDNSNDNRPAFLQDNQTTAYFGHYPLYLTCDIKQGTHAWQLHATDDEYADSLSDVANWLEHIIKTNRPILSATKPFSLRLQWSYKDYLTAFTKTQAYLRAGDCYQINLTQVWQGELPINSTMVDYLPKLHAHTNTPFAGYLSIQKFELLSCSPELFVTFSMNEHREHVIETKPIKGTRPRGVTAVDDNRLKTELANSKKDLAENVMIVDLLRNDLGKYAKVGTVKVPKRFAIESFNNVHHMVSTITATLKPEIHPLTMLFDSLPAGSITGTPKKRAVQIINELEQQPRGAYCGTMGYMNFEGTGQWNVLIRTLQAKGKQVSLWAGGGVTISSTADAEFEECWDKINNIIDVLENA